MSIRKVAWFAVLSSVLGAVSPMAASASAEKCMFNDYAAVSVEPYHQDEDLGLGTHSQLRGAQVYVAAQPGLTAEWLTLSVQREIAQMSGKEQCASGVRDIRVSVTSAGGGFWVALAAPEARSAKALLSWVRGIVPAAK